MLRVSMVTPLFVKIIDNGLHFIFSLTLFFFFFFFIFHFLFLEQLGLGFISHAVTSVTNQWHSHRLIMGLRRME